MANEVITFGCRLNSYESEHIKSLLSESKQENLIVFNSCAVTSKAERQLRQSIRRAAKENPESKIVVTGCAAQIDPAKYAAMQEVSLVLGNEEKSKLASYTGEGAAPIIPSEITSLNSDVAHKDQLFLETRQKNSFFDPALEEKILVNDIMSVKDTASHLVSYFENHSRAFVQIQNGCNHRCTFCIIPYGRGNSRSVAFGEIVNQVKKLVDNGYNEVVLTGVDVTDYGKDLLEGLTFSKMIKRLLKLVPELPRLRISSIDVAEVDNDLLDIIANEDRFMPYVHISLQAGDDVILKRMKRRHNRQQVLDFCKQVRGLRPDVAYGSDIIAGFPTETEEMFLNTYNLIQEAGIVFNHIFPYSIREGTPAAKMPQVAGPIKKQRAHKLREISKFELHKFMDNMVGTKQKVIKEDGDLARCENFVTVKVDYKHKKGSVFEVDVVSREGDYLLSS